MQKKTSATLRRKPTAHGRRSRRASISRSAWNKLRKSLKEAETERDQLRSMLLELVRRTMTEEDKKEIEERSRDVLENGGVPFEDVLREIKQYHR